MATMNPSKLTPIVFNKEAKTAPLKNASVWEMTRGADGASAPSSGPVSGIGSGEDSSINRLASRLRNDNHGDLAERREELIRQSLGESKSEADQYTTFTAPKPKAKPKASALRWIAPATVAFIALNGAVLYYLPKVLGDPRPSLPAPNFIEEIPTPPGNVRLTAASHSPPSVQPAAKPALLTAAVTPKIEASVSGLKPPTQPVVAPVASAAPAIATRAQPAAPPVLKAANPPVQSVVAVAAPVRKLAVAAPIPAAAPIALSPATVIKHATATAAPIDAQKLAKLPVSASVTPAGEGPLVQIGALPSTALANDVWSKAAALMGPAMDGKVKSFQPVAKNGATLYRALISGFETPVAAKTFCEKLSAKGIACFVRPKTIG